MLLAVAGYAVVTKLDADDPAPVPKGPATLKTISVTIPEGYTEEEMAGVAKDAGLEGSYEDAAKKAAKKFDFKKAGAPSGTDTLEGFLFPATYELEKGAPADALVGEQLNAFDSNFAEVDMSYAEKKNLTIYDVVTIASMIEREVQVPKERPLVAAVIYNRLADGEIAGHRRDAPLRGRLRQAPDRERAARWTRPYNTRLVPGPAADADRQPRPRLPAGRRRPGRRRLQVLRLQARDLRRAHLHGRLRRVPAAVR